MAGLGLGDGEVAEGAGAVILSGDGVGGGAGGDEGVVRGVKLTGLGEGGGEVADVPVSAYPLLPDTKNGDSTLKPPATTYTLIHPQ